MQDSIRAPESESCTTALDMDSPTLYERYRAIKTIPRRPSYFVRDFDQHVEPSNDNWDGCHFEGRIDAATPDEAEFYARTGDNRSEEDSKIRESNDRKRKGICLAISRYCESCEMENARKQEQGDTRQWEEGYEDDGDSMFVLNLDKILGDNF